MAAFVNGAPEEIVFGNNMTTITFHLARGLAHAWRAGDEIVVTELDHHANVAPWQAVAAERGLRLRWLALDTSTGQSRLDQLPALLNDRTRLLAIGAASNALGTVTDVAAAAALAHEAGALVFVDGVHYAPHVLPDVVALGCDFFACSPYKFYGPHTGMLWGRRALLDAVAVPKLDPAPAESPERLETGTQNHEGIVGAAAAVRWLASLAGSGGELRASLALSYHVLHQRQSALFKRLWQGIGAIPAATRYGPDADARRTGTLALSLRGRNARAVTIALAEEGCFVSHGDFYATTVAERLGMADEGLVRIGVAAYTTESEVDRVVAGIARLAD
jgi:cysteine desulfurase family protein (TIGR01976 family)